MNQRATEYTLNANQFEQLKTLYIETIVDSMSVEDLQVYVTNDMADFVDKLTEHDLFNEINYTLDESMLDEFITSIKRQSS